jgi:hypothetical protein
MAQRPTQKTKRTQRHPAQDVQSRPGRGPGAKSQANQAPRLPLRARAQNEPIELPQGDTGHTLSELPPARKTAFRHVRSMEQAPAARAQGLLAPAPKRTHEPTRRDPRCLPYGRTQNEPNGMPQGESCQAVSKSSPVRTTAFRRMRSMEQGDGKTNSTEKWEL